MAKNKLQSKIEYEVLELEQEANRLYNERLRVLAQITILTKMLKDEL